MRTSQFAISALVVGALVGGASMAQAQSSAEVGRGKEVWFNSGCDACHSIGYGVRAGPDLKGVTQRRTKEWLRKWLHDPDQMRASDPLAQQITKEAHGIKMWNPHLSDADIDAVLAYIAGQSGK